MNETELFPPMMVEDVKRTVDFYRLVLGFELVMAPEQDPLHWALIRHGEAEVMIQARSCLAEVIPSFLDQPLRAALTFYIGTENVALLYEQLRQNVTVVRDMHTTCCGTREFSIQDCNGFILTFASSN